MRRLELLETEIRRVTSTKDRNSLSQWEIQKYFRDAVKAIQSVVFLSNPTSDIFVKTFLYDINNTTNVYPLPNDIYAMNSVVSLSLFANNRTVQTLRRTSFKTANMMEYSLIGKNIVLNSRYNSSNQMLLTYEYQVPTPSFRVSKVSAVNATLGTLTLALGYLEEFEENYEFLSIVDKYGNPSLITDSQGNEVVRALYIDSFNAGTRVVTITGDLTGVTTDDYIVCGINASSHPQLPEECEPYILSYAQRRILNKLSSSDFAIESAYTADARDRIAEIFANSSPDSLYPPMDDSYHLDYN